MNDSFFCCGRPFTSSQASFPILTDYAIIHTQMYHRHPINKTLQLNPFQILSHKVKISHIKMGFVPISTPETSWNTRS